MEREKGTNTKAQLVYDDACPLCLGCTRAVRRLDAGSRIDLVPVSRSSLPQQFAAIDRKHLGTQIHLALDDGGIVSGSDALAQVLRRLPGWTWLGWFLLLPGIRYLAGRLYRIIARNRHRIFGTARPASSTGPGQ